jgi:hypothetical protein
MGSRKSWYQQAEAQNNELAGHMDVDYFRMIVVVVRTSIPVSARTAQMVAHGAAKQAAGEWNAEMQNTPQNMTGAQHLEKICGQYDVFQAGRKNNQLTYLVNTLIPASTTAAITMSDRTWTAENTQNHFGYTINGPPFTSTARLPAYIVDCAAGTLMAYVGKCIPNEREFFSEEHADTARGVIVKLLKQPTATAGIAETVQLSVGRISSPDSAAIYGAHIKAPKPAVNAIRAVIGREIINFGTDEYPCLGVVSVDKEYGDLVLERNTQRNDAAPANAKANPARRAAQDNRTSVVVYSTDNTTPKIEAVRQDLEQIGYSQTFKNFTTISTTSAAFEVKSAEDAVMLATSQSSAAFNFRIDFTTARELRAEGAAQNTPIKNAAAATARAKKRAALVESQAQAQARLLMNSTDPAAKNLVKEIQNRRDEAVFDCMLATNSPTTMASTVSNITKIAADDADADADAVEDDSNIGESPTPAGVASNSTQHTPPPSPKHNRDGTPVTTQVEADTDVTPEEQSYSQSMN